MEKMGLSSSNPSSLIMFLNVLLISVALFARPSTSLLISEVCDKTRNPSFCKNVLASDPRSRTASLPVLEQIAIDIATSRTTSIKTKIHSLFVNEKDARLKNIYGQCDNSYSLALEGLRAAKAFAGAGRQRDVNVAATVVSDDAVNCEKFFSQPPPRRSTLSNDNLTVELLSNIIAVIANML